jgi:DME family drug/metabolite transporter
VTERPSSAPHQGAPAVAAVLGAAVLFGTAGTARELGPEAATAISVGAVRIAIGTLVLWAVVFAERGVLRRPMVVAGGRVRWWLTVVGGAGVATYTPLFFVAVDHTGVAVGTVVTIASGPLFAGAIEWLVVRRRPTGRWFLDTAVTIVGSAVVVLSGAGDATVDASGVVAASAAGLGYAVYSITAKGSIEDGMSPTLALAAPFTVGALVVVAMASTSEFGWLRTGPGLVMAVYLGAFATGLAYVLFGRGLRGLVPSTAVTLVLAEPVTAALLAALVLDEPLGAAGWLGVGLVVAGLRTVGAGDPAPRSTVSVR